MAFRELSMIDVKELLRRWQAGQSARQIAKDRVADRKTASRYIEAAIACGLERNGPLEEKLIAEIATRVQGRDPVPPSAEWLAFEAQRKCIESWLKGPEALRLVRVDELLKRKGVEGSYTTLRRFAHQELGWRERPATVRVDDPPMGEEAQVDFGSMGYVQDDGRRRRLWVLIVMLTVSRYMFVWPTFLQTRAGRSRTNVLVVGNAVASPRPVETTNRTCGLRRHPSYRETCAPAAREVHSERGWVRFAPSRSTGDHHADPIDRRPARRRACCVQPKYCDRRPRRRDQRRVEPRRASRSGRKPRLGAQRNLQHEPNEVSVQEAPEGD